jgi:hypothetical protein
MGKSDKEKLIDEREELDDSPPRSRRTHAESRRTLNDPNYKGEDYMIDIELRKGPLKNRRCTDCLCLFIFSGVIGAMIYVGVYAVEHGDLARIVAPLDAEGNFCGLGDYAGYDYLYYAKIDTAIWTPWSVCVTECPTAQTTIIDCKTTENVVNCNANEYPHYDTINVFDIWCIPDFSTLPPAASPYYTGMIGDIGLDDLFQQGRDILDGW